MHGIHVHGFPNLFIIGFAQGANLISNITSNLADSGTTIAAVVRHALETGADEVEVTAEAEQSWMDLLDSSPASFFGNADCTPGYYNNEGQPLNSRARFGYGRLPARPGRVLRVHRQVAQLRRLRRPRVPHPRTGLRSLAPAVRAYRSLSLLVVATPPEAGLVATQGRSIQRSSRARGRNVARMAIMQRPRVHGRVPGRLPRRAPRAVRGSAPNRCRGRRPRRRAGPSARGARGSCRLRDAG